MQICTIHPHHDQIWATNMWGVLLCVSWIEIAAFITVINIEDGTFLSGAENFMQSSKARKRFLICSQTMYPNVAEIICILFPTFSREKHPVDCAQKTLDIQQFKFNWALQQLKTFLALLFYLYYSKKHSKKQRQKGRKVQMDKLPTTWEEHEIRAIQLHALWKTR